MPGNVQVTGFDGITLAHDFDPAVTTVDIGLAGIGTGVAARILEGGGGEDIVLPATVVPGATTVLGEGMH